MSYKRKILIFAHYYHPDVASTGQILKDLAEGMLDEYDVTVICVVPSYDGKISPKYRVHKYYFEEVNGVKIIRVKVPEFNKSSKISRVANIVAYFFRAIGAVRRCGKQEYVFTISQPPILGGLLGVYGKWAKKAKMIYCIQDFNPEQTMAVGYYSNRIVLKCMMIVDKFSCRRSDLIITVGRDLVETLKNRFRNKNVPNHIMINNWIDEKEVYPLPADNKNLIAFLNQYDLTDKFVIMYSGNIGLYYDLENLIKVIEKFKPGTKAADGREVVFAFVGAGSILDKLKFYVREHNMKNVTFIPYQDKANLLYSLNAADVHWCVNAKGIKGVSCPSKYYGIAATSKPILGVLEVGSEARMLIEETGGGLVSEPGDYEAVEANIRNFINNAGNHKVVELGTNGYFNLINNLTKDVNINKYKEAIKSC